MTRLSYALLVLRRLLKGYRWRTHNCADGGRFRTLQRGEGLNASVAVYDFNFKENRPRTL